LIKASRGLALVPRRTTLYLNSQCQWKPNQISFIVRLYGTE
jgi:hypothetical protein